MVSNTNTGQVQEIYDNTKVAAKRTCARKYYFRHVRMWRTEGLAPPLTFGLAWHAAMDVVWMHYGKWPEKELIQIAMDSFKQVWMEEDAPDMDTTSLDVIEAWTPRIPAIAHEMLYGYLKIRAPILAGMELLSSESPFVVPLWPEEKNIWFAGRTDKKIMYRGSRIVIEHKSTTEYKKDGGFKANYVEGWSMAAQPMSYLYSDNILSQGKTDYVYVDAALVHKNVHDAFRLIPVQHKYGQLDQWLFDTRREVEEIRRDTHILHDLRASGVAQSLEFMPVFGRNQESCVNAYGKCPYFNMCTQFPNPEQFEGVPPGFIEEEWNPFDVLGLQALFNDKEDKDGEDQEAVDKGVR